MTHAQPAGEDHRTRAELVKILDDLRTTVAENETRIRELEHGYAMLLAAEEIPDDDLPDLPVEFWRGPTIPAEILDELPSGAGTEGQLQRRVGFLEVRSYGDNALRELLGVYTFDGKLYLEHRQRDPDPLRAAYGERNRLFWWILTEDDVELGPRGTVVGKNHFDSVAWDWDTAIPFLDFGGLVHVDPDPNEWFATVPSFPTPSQPGYVGSVAMRFVEGARFIGVGNVTLDEDGEYWVSLSGSRPAFGTWFRIDSATRRVENVDGTRNGSFEFALVDVSWPAV